MCGHFWLTDKCTGVFFFFFLSYQALLSPPQLHVFVHFWISGELVEVGLQRQWQTEPPHFELHVFSETHEGRHRCHQNAQVREISKNMNTNLCYRTVSAFLTPEINLETWKSVLGTTFYSRKVNLSLFSGGQTIEWKYSLLTILLYFYFWKGFFYLPHTVFPMK